MLFQSYMYIQRLFSVDEIIWFFYYYFEFDYDRFELADMDNSECKANFLGRLALSKEIHLSCEEGLFLAAVTSLYAMMKVVRFSSINYPFAMTSEVNLQFFVCFLCT